jgi:predicted AlkP superfamily phosphohydrolase/phosphomutase
MPPLRAVVGKSKCVPVPNGSPVGGIRLNRVGREPQGVLGPGSQTDAFCEELIGDLCAIIDERTGRPLITDVYRTDALYAGARREALPDLLVEWNGDVPTGTLAHAGGRGATVRATSAKIGAVEGTNSYGRTGDHVPIGTFVFAGPGVSASRREEPVSVMDFHPTVCALMGLPDPNVDGVVIPELVTPRM